MSKLRSLNTAIWSDTWFELLEPSAKLLFIYLVTNEKTNMLGVYEISLRKVSFETGIIVKDIEKYLKEFEVKNKIKYAENRVLLLNFLKHQNYNFNMMKSAIRTYNELPKKLKIKGVNKLQETKQGFETLCNGFAGVRKIEVEYEVEYEDEIEDEIESKTIYQLETFLKDWNKLRFKILKKPSHVKRLSSNDSREQFKEISNAYTQEEIHNAMLGLFKQQIMPKGIDTLRTTPVHFLKEFERYLQAYNDKNKYLYGDKKE